MPPSQTSRVPYATAYQRWERTDEEKEADRIVYTNKALQEIEAKYRHLPTLPPQLPGPLYIVQGASVFNKDDASVAFYQACSHGNLEHVRASVQTSQPSAADLAYGLEEACHNFQVDVVCFLMQLPDIQLHYRCFRRCPECPNDDIAKNFGRDYEHETSRVDSQSILASGHSSLLNLLKALVEFGWHPNQLLGPPQKGKDWPLCQPRQEVALHFPRCIVDLEILRFLLDAGADPTIARNLHMHPGFGLRVANYPVERMSGDILDMAANLGAIEAVHLLVSAGAKPAYGMALHRLVLRRPDYSYTKTVDDSWRETPEVRYSIISTRLEIASLLLDYGEDINKLANIWPIVQRYCGVPTMEHIVTAVSHAKDSMDWAFVKWLLENGADPTTSLIGPGKNHSPELVYRIGTNQFEIENTYHNIIEEIGETRRLILKREVKETKDIKMKQDVKKTGEVILKREV